MSATGDVIEKQEWLRPVEAALQGAADATLNQAGTPVRNFLHGTWLGHPLHPLITDVPIGSWTVAAVLDGYELATGDDRLAGGADVAVGVGVLGAFGAAISGLNDWQHTSDKPRRVGALHALLNLSATALYVASWFQRRRGNRPAGIASGLAGFGLSMAGAYLGGHLVFKEKIGVNHAPDQLGETRADFVPVLAEAELSEGQMRKADANGTPVMLVRLGGRIFALAQSCSHLGGPLSEGKLEGASVRCPWHGSRFALEDGAVLEGPAAFPQPCFETRVRAGQIEVRARRPVAALE